jgi:molecular chaperone DnaK
MESGDLNRIRSAVQALSESVQKVGASMYQEPGSTPPPDGGYGAGPDNGEDVVEGEFTEA